ncbi:hybrid sensor histidine kinase/response regulator [Egbenema bharatensis]|uniref:hybrid sensor histidine kinase/response regulator n=1 Tax=Egbenema bharatensis TaxID=3463334 RepID=UPI003A8766F8
MKVLLIEDHLAEARLLQEFLKGAAFNQFALSHVQRLQDALNHLTNDRFDVILLDLTLPDSQGLASLDALTRYTPNVPIVVLTNTNDDELAVSAVRHGAQDYLVKRSVNQDILVRSLRYAIERKQASVALREANEALEIRVQERTAELARTNEQLQAEVHHRQRVQERLELAQKAGRIGSFEWDLTTNRVTWSTELEALYGQPANTFNHRCSSWLHTVYPDDQSRVDQALQQAVREGIPLDTEFRIVDAQNQVRWIAAKGTVFYDENRSPLRIIGVHIDITNRKQSEQKIAEQAALLDISTDAIFVTTLDYRILFWNQGAERLYGWGKTEVLERNAIDLLYPPELSTLPLQDIQQTLRRDGIWQSDLKQVTKTSKSLLVQSRWTLVRDEHDEPKSILIVNTDITEKRQLEEQFLRAQRLESLGTLAGGIAHDLNNVFTPVLAIAKLMPLRIPDLSEKNRQMLQTLEHSAQCGADLVKQILLFARGVEGERRSLQVGVVLGEVEKMLRQTFPATIQIQTHVAPDLHRVLADPTQLHQVLMNLCVNARDAMPNGGSLKISAGNFEVDEQYARLHLDASLGSYVMLTIADTGTGITPEVINHIFDPFFTTKEVGKGTGLGLSAVLGIVRSHGGFIDVQSEVGQGSHFRVFLPVHEEAAD